MHRVDTATAIATLPTQNPAGSPGYFTEGSPTGSPPATVPGQDWFNSAQEELVAPILAEGLALSKTENNQLYQAMRRIAARTIGGMSNVNFASSVAANALTNELKGQNGADPSATNPVEATFRSTTLIDTGLVLRRITLASVVTAPQGATLGFIPNEIGYVYKYLCDDGATQRIGICKKAIFDESQLHSTTAIGVGSDADNVLYTNVALPTAAVRLIGRELIQHGAIAGDWSNASTRREIWTPAMSKTTGVLATFSGASSTSFIVTATPVSPVNVEAGDLVSLYYTTNCLRNGADFSVHGTVNRAGTAVLETTGLANDGLPFLIYGLSMAPGTTLENSFSATRRVATAGTITSAGCSAFLTNGTAPTNIRSHLRVVITRPNS